jgi:hypothetical protein
MNSRKVTLVVCLVLAAALQVIARHYYGSQRHQALLLVMTYALVADAVWLFAGMVARAETPLPSNATVATIIRVLAIGVVSFGIWQGLKLLGYVS